MKENESNKYAIECEQCDAFVAYALTYFAAKQAKIHHSTVHSHPLKQIHVRHPKKK